MSLETTTLLNDDSNDISLASLQKTLPSAANAYDDSFKSPTEMMEQDVASRRNSRVRRRRRLQHRPAVRRHSSFELRHKSALEKRQANMNEFLNDIKDANTGFHDSIMDFANISSEEEETAQQTKSFAESCPILSYFDSDGEDSIDLARERRPSLASIADVAAPSAEAMQITDTDVMLDESEETAASGVPAMTNYVLALPECVTESARQEARGRTKRRRSYTRKRKERARARQARGLVGTDDAATAQTYHASLANWYESYADEATAPIITPQATAARLSSTTNWIDEQLSGEEDEGDEQKKQPSDANDDGDDLGSSLAAFLHEYNANRQDYESEVSSGGDEKFCSDDAVA